MKMILEFNLILVLLLILRAQKMNKLKQINIKKIVTIQPNKKNGSPDLRGGATIVALSVISDLHVIKQGLTK